MDMPPPLTAQDHANVEAALRADPEAADDLRSLIAGEHGEVAGELFARCYARHLRLGRTPILAMLPAFADGFYLLHHGTVNSRRQTKEIRALPTRRAGPPGCPMFPSNR